jgi:glycosyltransferase involved in cell wall biosynthesis
MRRTPIATPRVHAAAAATPSASGTTRPVEPLRRERPLRVVIASHSHPEISNGGAEIASFELFRGLLGRPDCRAWYIGCDRTVDGDRAGTTISQPFSDREYVYGCAEFDWFKFANRDVRFPGEISRLFRELAPDVVHFHHYINFGLEVFLHVKRAMPKCRILLTLHEYLAVCHHYGQMVTTRHRNLCFQSSPARCNQCFPELGRSEFFLRKRYIERFFGLVDTFIAPSRFLAERYIAWGVPEDRMVVMENVLPADERAATASLPPTDGPLCIGFFGQISALKGINVLFDTADALAAQGRADVTLEIYGDYRSQPAEFQQDFLARLAKAGGNVRFHGPYERARVDRLMQSVHAVLVPSIWWENSPVVIQEALRNRRPIICSDIGGMAEKVRDGIDGFHFPVGNSIALSSLLLRLAKTPARLKAIAASMHVPVASTEIIAQHERLYEALLA